MSRTQVPWEFSPEPSPDATTPNLPSDEGRRLGYHLWRFVEAEAADWPEAPERCDDCAFRFGTDPNGSAETLMDALKCVMEGRPFGCHRNRANLCAGYVTLRHASSKKVPA